MCANQPPPPPPPKSPSLLSLPPFIAHIDLLSPNSLAHEKSDKTSPAQHRRQNKTGEDVRAQGGQRSHRSHSAHLPSQSTITHASSACPHPTSIEQYLALSLADGMEWTQVYIRRPNRKTPCRQGRAGPGRAHEKLLVVLFLRTTRVFFGGGRMWVFGHFSTTAGGRTPP